MIPEKKSNYFRGPSILPIARALKMKAAPKSPVLLSFTEEEWERSIRGIEVTKEPILEGAATLAAIQLPPELTPVGPIVVLGLCWSGNPNEACVPIYELRFPEGYVFVGCECIVFPDPEDETAEEPVEVEPPAVRFQCQLAYVNGQWRCEGTCEEGTCTLTLLNPARGLFYLTCACRVSVRRRRP